MEEYRNEEVIAAFNLIDKTRKDTHEIIKIIGRKPEHIKIFVAKSWKRPLFRELKEKIIGRESKLNEVIGELMQKQEYKQRGQQAVKIVKKVFNNPSLLPDLVFDQEQEVRYLRAGKELLEEEFNVDVHILPEDEGSEEKAKKALPSKPAILVNEFQ